MSQEKYIGMDVHDASISVAVKNAQGRLLMECVLETKAATILEFIQGLRGTLALTFEEGTLAAWLHDLLKPHVSRLVVCDPRKNALMRDGNQNDRSDARNLAELLGSNQIHGVYHGKHGNPRLKRGSHLGHRTPWAAAGILCGPGRERNAVQHGASRPGTEDCRHHSNQVQERSAFRP